MNLQRERENGKQTQQQRQRWQQKAETDLRDQRKCRATISTIDMYLATHSHSASNQAYYELRVAHHSHPRTHIHLPLRKLLGRTVMDLCRPRAGAAALLLARPRTAVKQHSTPVHSAAVSSTPECRTHAQLSPRARCCCNYPIRGQDAKLTPAEPPIARLLDSGKRKGATSRLFSAVPKYRAHGGGHR